MTLRTLAVSLAVMGFVGCAGAQTENQEPVSFTMEDVSAAPDAWRAVDPENLVVFETSKGQIVLELLPIAAPVHVERFKAYVRAGLYDGTEFHRVIKDFMAQGGDVAATHGAEAMMGSMEAEFRFRRNPAELPFDYVGPADAAEIGFLDGFTLRTQPGFLAEMMQDSQLDSWMPHCPGVLSSARTDDQNSADAQFFLISKDGQHLDEKYTAKGRTLKGLDVIQAIKLGPRPDGYPIANPDVLISAHMAADLPDGERPTAFVQRTDTAEWDAIRAEADARRTPVCDIQTVGAVVE